MASLSGCLLLDFGILFLALSSATYVFFSRRFRKWEEKGIYFIKPTPFLGNCKDIALGKKNIGQLISETYEMAKGKPVVGIFAFHRPMLIVLDLELIKQVLVKDFNYFTDRDINQDEKTEPDISNSIFMMHGQRWKHLRNKLTPAFTSGKIKRMFHFIDECANNLVSYVENHAVRDRLMVKETIAKYTTDVMASVVCGIQGHALEDENSEFRYYLRKEVDVSAAKLIKIAFGVFAPFLLNLLKVTLVDSDVAKYMRRTIWSTVDYRKKNQIIRKDLLDILMQLREKGHVETDETDEKQASPVEMAFELDGDDLVAQALGFLVAGSDTSSITSTFTLYELALHPDMQTMLRDEIQRILNKNDGKLTYEGIQEMNYMDMVLAETLRKYPVLPFLTRGVQHDYTFPSSTIHLDKGDSVVIPVGGIHYDPEFYPDPHRFDPERFTEENKRSRPSFTYMPFGEGPRNCIGMRLALLQIKVALAHLLSHFQISPCEDTPIPMQFDPKHFLLSPKGDLPLNIRRIQ